MLHPLSRFGWRPLLASGVAASLLGLTSAFLMPTPANEAPRTVRNLSFGRGEKLKYKIHYGIINAAEGIIETSGELHRVNERPCYRVTVEGRTTGSFDFFLRIRDQWRSFIDTTAILPQKFERNIAENHYRKKETVWFDHAANTVTVDEQGEKQRRIYSTADNVQDLVSGIFYTRTLDFTRRKIGESIRVEGFFDDESFDFTVTYQGKVKVDTKAGSFRCIRLVPKMPANKLFKGENAISVYLSDDVAKVPVLIQAEMFVGSVKLDLYEYQGVRCKLNQAAEN